MRLKIIIVKQNRSSPRILITESIETKNKKPIKETAEGKEKFFI